MLRSLLRDVFGERRPVPPSPPVTQLPQPTTPAPSFRYRRGGAILAFVPGSEGNALKEHTLEMLKPLESMCEETVLFDFADPEWLARLNDTAARPIWFALSPFGGGEFLPAEQSGAERNPWAEAGIPFVRLYGDTPAYFPVRHVQHAPTSVNAYGHAEHQEFFARWFPARAPTVTLPLFPFDERPRHEVDVQAKAASALVIFPKNGNSPQALMGYWRDALPPAVAWALEAVAEQARADLDAPLDLVAELQKRFAEFSIDLSGSRRLLFFLVAQLDDYLRREKSTLIARTLLDFPVVVRGVNWGHVDFSGRRARHDPDSDYGRTRKLLDQALAVVDMSPNTHRGAHDRVLRASGRYTAFVTNRQDFFVRNFPDHARFTFSLRATSIAERIAEVLARPRDTAEMGIAQAERMRQLFTRERYVEQMVALVDACALAAAERPAGTQNFVSYQPLPL